MAQHPSIWLLTAILSGLPFSMAQAQSPSDESTLELLQRIDQLEIEVRALRGELEMQRHWLERLNRERTTAAAAAPSPTTASAAPAPAALPPTAAQPAETSRTPTPAAAPPASPPADPAAEQASYDAALGELREGRYTAASTALQQFLTDHPNSKLAGDAQYWLGEAYYLNRNQSAAQEAFINLGLNHPQSARLPDALLKLGYLYSQQGDTAQARNILEKLVKVYPDTPAAELAKRRLESLR